MWYRRGKNLRDSLKRPGPKLMVSITCLTNGEASTRETVSVIVYTREKTKGLAQKIRMRGISVKMQVSVEKT